MMYMYFSTLIDAARDSLEKIINPLMSKNCYFSG